MKKIILIEKTILFTRFAIVIDNELIATYMESNLNPDNQNKVIVGQVDKIVKNLEAAFIDYGADKKGLLHLSQVPEVYKNKLHQGARIPVQIIKQNEGEKGHKLTSKINIKGKYLVCLPFEPGISISKKIKNQGLRNRLKEILGELSSQEYGFIVRTHAEHIPIQDIKEDALNLISKVNQFMQIKDNLTKGSVLHEEFPMYMQIVTENINPYEDVEIICDDLEMIKNLESMLDGYVKRNYIIQLSYFDNKEDLYQVYDLDKEMSALQNRKIWLKNGGNIVLDYTEALTVIDVNSAKAILSNNRRKSVAELNKLAIKESILQILRRNLSGIIILDLIEMPFNEDKEQIYLYAKKIMGQIENNRATVFPITELGLLQIVRAKRYTSIPTNLFAPCRNCKCSFGEFSNEYNAYLIEKRAKRRANQTINKEVTIECSREVADFFTCHGLVEKIENQYAIALNLIKVEKTDKSKFLC